MICSFCKAENETSTVTPGTTSSTLIASSPGYFDTGGRWVRTADPNTHTTGYRCSRGHYFTVASREGTPDVVTLGAQPTFTVTPTPR